MFKKAPDYNDGRRCLHILQGGYPQANGIIDATILHKQQAVIQLNSETGLKRDRWARIFSYS